MNYQREADRLFSLLVRQENADENGYVKCVTCGKMNHWRRMHNGHFMVRQNQATRYDRENTGVQCVKCNTFSEGRQYDFAKYLDQKYGFGTAVRINIKSKMRCHRGAAEYKYLIEKFKEELKSKGYLK